MTCGHWTPETGVCGAPAAHKYLTGPRCHAHTPAALAGRPEPGQTIGMELASLTREPRAYGLTTTDPLGRTGWVKDSHLPKRHDQWCDQTHGPKAACNSRLKAEA
jgi:hypothetical protein